MRANLRRAFRWFFRHVHHRLPVAMLESKNSSAANCQMQTNLRIDQRYLRIQRTAFVQNINKHGASHTTLTL